MHSGNFLILPAESTAPVLEVSRLSKRYPDAKTAALLDLDFKVGKGEIFGLLGPNGAGKTTTISILSTLMAPSGGSARVCGVDILKQPAKARQMISLVPQEIALYHELTGRENMAYFGILYGVDKKELNEKISMVLDLFDINEFSHRQIGRCSGGIQRRFNIACGILHDPALIFLDEPTVGMDVHARNALLEQIRHLSDKGCTLVYTTHYMEEAQEICSKILIMDKGAVLAQGRPAELIRENRPCRNLGDLFLALTQKRT